MFLIAVAALIGLIGTLLWYTNWAESHLLSAEHKPPTAETR